MKEIQLEGPFLLHNSFDVKMRKGGGKKKNKRKQHKWSLYS